MLIAHCCYVERVRLGGGAASVEARKWLRYGERVYWFLKSISGIFTCIFKHNGQTGTGKEIRWGLLKQQGAHLPNPPPLPVDLHPAY